MDNFFENNKAFAIFQVCEANDIIVTNLSFTPVYIRFGYAFTGFGGDALYFHIANITSPLGKHVAPPFSPNHVVFDNATAAPKLTLALESQCHISNKSPVRSMCWAYQEIQKESLPFTWIQCWFSRTQTIDRFIAPVVTKNLSIVLEELILPRAPPSSFTVSCILPRTFPKTWSNAFMQNSWHTITFELSWKNKIC